jgi:hypothetical protein
MDYGWLMVEFDGGWDREMTGMTSLMEIRIGASFWMVCSIFFEKLSMDVCR